MDCANYKTQLRRLNHLADADESAPEPDYNRATVARPKLRCQHSTHASSLGLGTRHRTLSYQFHEPTIEAHNLSTVLLARQLLTPLERIEDTALVIDSGIIAAVGNRDAVSIPARARGGDFGDSILTPGLIDIHVHGGAGHDVMEGSDESLAAIERLMAMQGATSFFPTPVPAQID